ncbi:hypothetical protein DGG96_14635 [Legionella qingyii]|uniref:Uncharacterized protein n=1 Tax=Legionella qingyii TaxID=2184757 RepID=A0A317U286_9GAMM|nr:hypothetical protein [Legionella qingyii]PWY54856.1 hypothetical protein DGG96_14635 [Legionella qingyii]RUR20942.1 hypothetical protein ELY20_14155 [Legionella qingyii]RUR23208.1 hypothetical protein ELY16_13510 [Legionella qingyii]
MFLKRFPENSLIKKIKISGPFISIYVPEAQLENFQKKYEQLLSRYSVLSIGEGMMHDFAHYTHNKSLSFLFAKKSNKEQNEHFHFILPATATEANLTTFLNFFEDKDLSKEQKQQLLKEFKEHSNTVTLETLSEQIKSYKYIISALLKRDYYLSKIMPLITEMVNNLEPYLSGNPDESVDISPSIMIKVGEHQVSACDAYNNLTAFLTHVGFLSSFEQIIDQLNKGGKEAATTETINKLNALFHSASTTPFPNFSTSPYLLNELVAHFPFIDGNLNNLYEMLKQQFASQLETEELIFVPQITNLPPEDISYNEAILFLSKQGNMGLKIMEAMARLQEGKRSSNPYWINSGTKLQGIVDAVLNLKNREEVLGKIVQNPESELYLALNKPRLLPLTFLGSFSVNKSKSMMKVEAEISSSLTC